MTHERRPCHSLLRPPPGCFTGEPTAWTLNCRLPHAPALATARLVKSSGNPIPSTAISVGATAERAALRGAFARLVQRRSDVAFAVEALLISVVRVPKEEAQIWAARGRAPN